MADMIRRHDHEPPQVFPMDSANRPHHLHVRRRRAGHLRHNRIHHRREYSTCLARIGVEIYVDAAIADRTPTCRESTTFE